VPQSHKDYSIPSPVWHTPDSGGFGIYGIGF
jgi:hypothetical protein